MSIKDHDQCACPFCDGDVDPEIVGRIMAAAAGPMSPAMSLEEFPAWLYSLDPAGDVPLRASA